MEMRGNADVRQHIYEIIHRGIYRDFVSRVVYDNKI